jgi:lamin tail-like protein/Big-like domain-containing protein
MKAKLTLLLVAFFVFSLSAVDVTIYEIQYTTDPSGDSPYAGQEVTTTGIVTGSNVSGYANNFYISMPDGGSWNGIYVYSSGIEPLLGDEVEVTLEVSEYFGLTELTGGTGSILSSGNTLPAPVVISTSTLSSEEEYEGVLVRVENASATSTPDSFGQWYANDGSGDCQIDDSIFSYPDLQMGMEFASITGLVDYSFDEYGLHPRDINDFETSGEDTTPPEINSAIATSSTTVSVNFSEAVSNATAENLNNYDLDGLTLVSAELQANNTTLILTTSQQTEGENYTLVVNGVEDLAENVIEDDTEIDFTGYQEGGPDLFISEYLEGSSNNKAIEIYNGTGSAVDLSTYAIWRISNGGDWAEGESNAVELSGTLQNDDVFVICNDAAIDAIQQVSDMIGSTATYFNGNDAVGLAHNGIIIDAVGEEGADIGTAWDVAGVTEATLNHTLVRKSAVTAGNLVWSSSAGTNETDSEWIVLELDDISNLGMHQGSGDDETPPVVSSAAAISETSVEINFNEPLDQTSSETLSNYQIVPALTITSAVLSGNKVTLTTSQQTAGESYTITINNVEDLAGNVILPDTEVQFTGYGGFEYDLIADIQNNTSSYEGQSVTIRGIVTIGVNTIQTDRTNAYIQDNSGRGINIYDMAPILTLVRGSEVEITGTVTQYFDTTEITNPQVTVHSVNNPEPTPYVLDLANINDVDLEGTLLVVQGEVYEQYWAGGGTNLNIRDENNNEITVRVWDTAGLDISSYVVGFNLQAIGIGSAYNGQLQLVPAYEDQLSEAQNVEEGIVIDPENPTSSDDVAIFFTDNTHFESVLLYWKKTTDEDYNIVDMESLDSIENTWGAILPAQKEGTTVIFYLAAYLGEEITYVPEGAPEEVMSYNIDITSLKAILNVPPKPFNPYIGEKIPIEFGSRGGVKAILRIYDAEGKLVFTPQNLILNTSDVLTYEWDGRDKNHKLLPLGLYILHLEVIEADTGNKRSETAPVVIGAPLD